MDINVYFDGILEFDGKTYCCSLGKGGIGQKQGEGDNITPMGSYYLRQVFYRADRVTLPKVKLKMRVIQQNDGWCDDPDSPDYNRLIELPSKYGHEKMWRDDDIYDIVIPIGYNDDPVEPGKGSAIFMHLARPNYSPTHGCVALSKPDLLEIVEKVDPDTKIHIHVGKS